MPRTCLVPKKLISLLFGYRNYLGKELLHDINNGEPISIPDDNPVIKTFPYVLDQPDIRNEVLRFWAEKVSIGKRDLLNVPELIKCAVEAIQRVYPLVYCDQFNIGTEATDPALAQKRA